ncbi:MAG TPA: MCE family protein [Paenalcaligenes hominis]|uniref:MCE family protein n=1 Tax=Paenalcaligenes hominis TaxID=643674 RepID=A0A9D2VG46_9BURK|nr:MlaD family protein [Paenalcaligenes hominis]NJB65463.1 phospholipid/cholesterol/gamma-HCH transport system substrate-binding protein [Paenalcaligenes hominis]GGE65688.1 hypothetical protein GCM10007278_12340 [Paenalcaligenes hominis]HJH24001.1 MCE family protein [Paenalcaligenes hominis]
MEPRAHHILIGVFTLVVATCAILFSLWLTKAGSENKTKDYIIVFTEAVRGLSRGSAVQFNGIRIGEVTKLSLDPNDIRRVLVDVSIQETIPIKEDTKARLALTGITGTSVIELQAGSPNSQPLESTDTQPAIIYATPSPIASLMAGGEELMTNISELLINANAFLSSDNAKRINSSLAELESLLQHLAEGSNDLPDLLAELKKTTIEAGGIIADTRKLINTDGPQAFAKANQAIDHLAQAAQQIQDLIQSNSGSITQGSQGFAQLAPAMTELRQTLLNIKHITQELQNNPTEYLLGGEKLQEFQP